MWKIPRNFIEKKLRCRRYAISRVSHARLLQSIENLKIESAKKKISEIEGFIEQIKTQGKKIFGRGYFEGR